MKPYLSRFQGNISICEVGAATGRNLLGFSAKANKDGVRTTLIGCDYAESSVEAGRKNNIDFYLGDAATLVKNGVKCDLLILSHVLEHFVDIKFHLDCIRRLLNKNGLLYIEVPGVMDLKNRYGCDYAKYVTGAHIYHFNRATLVHYVEREGFHCIYADEYGRGVFEINGNRETGIDLSTNYDTTLHYLSDLYDNKEYYASLAKGNLFYRLARKMVPNQLKPLLKWIIRK